MKFHNCHHTIVHKITINSWNSLILVNRMSDSYFGLKHFCKGYFGQNFWVGEKFCHRTFWSENILVRSFLVREWSQKFSFTEHSKIPLLCLTINLVESNGVDGCQKNVRNRVIHGYHNRAMNGRS